MAEYLYTDENRLDKPHKYMYTSYLGFEFISAYFDNRMKHLKRFQLIKNKVINDDINLYLCSQIPEYFNHFFKKKFDLNINKSKSFKKKFNIKDLALYSLTKEIDTESILLSIIFCQLKNIKNSDIKYWLDRIVQRFEVSKKLYVRYRIGFRKGLGDKSKVNLYWLLSLSLALFYAQTRNTKYLSTLLKVNDLLCSLDDNILLDQVPIQGVSIMIKVEMFSIRLLSRGIEEINFEKK